VCHVLGNGLFHLLTFDHHALEAHLAHGDIYPAPADEADCAEVLGSTGNTPSTDTDTPATGTPHGDVDTPPADAGTPAGETTTSEGIDTVAEELVQAVQVLGAEAQDVEVLGVQAERESPASAVLAQSRAVNRGPAVVRPGSGVLPNTGAEDYLPVLLGGLGLLAAAAALLGRRRPQGTR
jgi:LPXTG-motif cell wall-anchored protein